LLDAFDEVNRGGGAPHGWQHKTQRCTSVFVVVDLQNLRGAPKALNQLIELPSPVETVDFEADR
jgi:hypothetical protein